MKSLDLEGKKATSVWRVCFATPDPCTGKREVGINNYSGGTHFRRSIDSSSHLFIKHTSNITSCLLILFFQEKPLKTSNRSELF